jgi:hypothetical protein
MSSERVGLGIRRFAPRTGSLALYYGAFSTDYKLQLELSCGSRAPGWTYCADERLATRDMGRLIYEERRAFASKGVTYMLPGLVHRYRNSGPVDMQAGACTDDHPGSFPKYLPIGPPSFICARLVRPRPAKRCNRSGIVSAPPAKLRMDVLSRAISSTIEALLKQQTTESRSWRSLAVSRNQAHAALCQHGIDFFGKYRGWRQVGVCLTM